MSRSGDYVAEGLRSGNASELQAVRAPRDERGEGQVDLRREVHQMREAMDSRAAIEQAKGMLMLRYGVDADRAFAVLRRWSQDSNTKLRTIADALVNAVCPVEQPGDCDPALVGWLRAQIGRDCG